jgi:hypothetical protein
LNIDDEAAEFGGIDDANKPGPTNYKSMKVLLAGAAGSLVS